MKYITSYEANKIKDSAIERNSCMVSQVDALKALVGGADALFYKNGRSKLGGKRIKLGETKIYAKRNDERLELYHYSEYVLCIKAGCDDKQAMIDEAKVLLIDATDRAGKSALEVANIEARIEALDALAEKLIAACKQYHLSSDERDIIFRMIRYKI